MIQVTIDTTQAIGKNIFGCSFIAFGRSIIIPLTIATNIDKTINNNTKPKDICQKLYC